jgi:Niemann-Pick C1 protein
MEDQGQVEIVYMHKNEGYLAREVQFGEGNLIKVVTKSKAGAKEGESTTERRPTAATEFTGISASTENEDNTKSLTIEKKQNPEEPRSCFEKWDHYVNHYFKKPLLKLLVALSRKAAENPGATVMISIIVSAFLLVTGLFTNFYIESDGNTVWTPSTSKPTKHEQWIDSPESGFPPKTRNIRTLIHARNDNVLTLQGASCLFDVIETIQDTEGYEELCREKGRENDGCPIMAATAFAEHNRTKMEEYVATDDDLRRAVSQLRYPNGEPVFRHTIFGYPEPELPPMDSLGNATEEELLLTSAKSYLVQVMLPPQNELLAKEYELKIIDNILYQLNEEWTATDQNCVVELETARSFDDEVKRGIVKDIPFMAMAFLIMGLFCAVYLSKRHNPVRSQSVLGLGAVVTIILSIISGYGLLFICGVPFTSITQIFPYVMVGIGLDDTFIMTGALARTNPRDDVVDRVVYVMEEVGIGITSSTVTTVVAFFLGCTSSIPGVRWFCWYAAPTVLIDFIYQITFFVAILVYDDRRIKANRYDCLVCVKSKHVVDQNGPHETTEHKLTTKVMTRYSNVLLHPVTKVFVLVCFAGLLVLGILGASQQKQKLDFRDMMPEDSYFRDYFNAIDTYTSSDDSAHLLIGVYFRDVDVSDYSIQAQMNNYVDDLVALPFISKQPNFFWLRDFHQFVQNNASTANLTFAEQLDIFLGTSPYNLYTPHVVRDENRTVTASRTFVVFDGVSLYEVRSQIDALKAQRKVTSEQPVNLGKEDNWSFFTFGGRYYIWELFTILVGELLQSLVLGLIAVFGIALVFIPHPIGALLLTPIVAAIYAEVLAVLYLAGVYINGVSAIGMVMSVGLVVDYNFHMVLTYYETTNAVSRRDRVQKTLTTMGASIALGGFTTFLGVLPLSFTNSEVFRTFFFTFLAIPLLGVAHGLVLLPVLLSLVGPNKDQPNDALVSSDASRIQKQGRDKTCDSSSTEGLSEPESAFSGMSHEHTL